jgi:hypothetical protein
VTAGRTKLRHLAGGLIAASVGTELLAMIAHHEKRRELPARSILVSAFALWGIVQTAPGPPGNLVFNDVVIVLFVIDLAILVSPWI